MNTLADESVEQQIVERLREDGHTVLYVTEMEPSIPDDLVLHRANEQQCLLITVDKDFGELVFRQGLVHRGVVLVRLTGLSARAKAGIVAQAFAERGAELPDCFTVISPGMVRIRHRPLPA